MAAGGVEQSKIEIKVRLLAEACLLEGERFEKENYCCAGG